MKESTNLVDWICRLSLKFNAHGPDFGDCAFWVPAVLRFSKDNPNISKLFENKKTNDIKQQHDIIDFLI